MTTELHDPADLTRTRWDRTQARYVDYRVSQLDVMVAELCQVTLPLRRAHGAAIALLSRQVDVEARAVAEADAMELAELVDRVDGLLMAMTDKLPDPTTPELTEAAVELLDVDVDQADDQGDDALTRAQLDLFGLNPAWADLAAIESGHTR